MGWVMVAENFVQAIHITTVIKRCLSKYCACTGHITIWVNLETNRSTGTKEVTSYEFLFVFKYVYDCQHD